MVGKSDTRVWSSVAASSQKNQKAGCVEEGTTLTLAGLCGELGGFFFPFLRLENLKLQGGGR